MSLPRRLLLAAALGCGLMMTDARGGDDKPASPEEAPIKALVAHFAKNGVKLEADKNGWWVVAEPKAEGYQVIVTLRTFPPGASEKDMQAALRMIALAHLLNAPARLAMSRPGLRITDPTKQPPKLDQIPVAAKLQKLFKEYRPLESAK